MMMNVGNPERAFDFCADSESRGRPGAAGIHHRHMIGVHPLALLEYASQPADLRAEIDLRIAGYADPVAFYVDKLAEGIATLAAAFCAQAGDRAAVGLQVQRIRQPARRRALRAEGGKPHARVARRARYVSEQLPACFRTGVPRPETGARRHGADQRRGDDPLRAHRGGRRRRWSTCWRTMACSAATTACA